MIVPLPLAIRRDEVLRFLGYPDSATVGRSRPARRRVPAGGAPGGRALPGTASARVDVLLDRALDAARKLADPRGAFRTLEVRDAGRIGLQPIEAEGLAAGLVTIGGALEDRVAALLCAGRATEALLLDAAGSAAVEEAADRLGAAITGTGAEAGHVSCRISPGYGRWPIESQRLLFDALPHGELGVSLLPTMLMAPRKSVSFAMWLGADARPLAGLSGCARCELEHCRYRRSA